MPSNKQKPKPIKKKGKDKEKESPAILKYNGFFVNFKFKVPRVETKAKR